MRKRRGVGVLIRKHRTLNIEHRTSKLLGPGVELLPKRGEDVAANSQAGTPTLLPGAQKSFARRGRMAEDAPRAETFNPE